TRPTSVAPPARSSVISTALSSLDQLQHGLADLQTVTLADGNGRAHLLAVEEGAVGGAQVLDEEVAVAAEQAGVQLGGVGVVEGDLTAGGPADGELVDHVVGAAALVGGLDDAQVGHGPLRRATLTLGLRRRRRRSDHGG